MSTCGAERGIGDNRHIFGKYENSADIQKVNDEIECTYIPDSDGVQMCTIAANLYIQPYGMHRDTQTAPKRRRCDIGTSRRWKRFHALPATETLQRNSLKLCKATAAEDYRQRGMSVQQMLKYGKTTLTQVVSRLVVASCDEASSKAIRKHRGKQFPIW